MIEHNHNPTCMFYGDFDDDIFSKVLLVWKCLCFGLAVVLTVCPYLKKGNSFSCDHFIVD